MSDKPFKDLKVLDFTWAGVGSFIVNYLAWYGATVIKIENVKRPDITRCSPPYKEGKPGMNRSLFFSWTHPAKKMDMTLNLNTEKGIAIAKRLAVWADVVVESFVAGTMEKWGLGYDELKAINPEVIMLRTCTHGQTGRLAKQPALGFTLTTLSGFNNITGWPEGGLNELRGAYTDFIAPLFGGFALIAAVDYKERTGKGQCIDLSQHEASLQFLSPLLLDAAVNKRNHKNNGNDCDRAAPHGVFRCKGEDRWCAISVFSDEQWMALCKVLGFPDWTKDSRYKRKEGRYEFRRELDMKIEEWTSRKTAEEVMVEMQTAGVPAGIVSTSKDLVEDPQLKQYHFYNTLEHPEIGECSFFQSPPFRLSDAAAEISTPPILGKHNNYICEHILNLSSEEISDLKDQQVFD